eukprot:scaffold34788_cov32-Tisochrysis_lutea.AAC.1
MEVPRLVVSVASRDTFLGPAVILPRFGSSKPRRHSTFNWLHAPPCQYIIYKISDDKTNIILDCLGDKGASFEEFCSKLPDNDCRYGILDVPITTKSGAETNKLIFVCWSDDNASVKPKMLYASSKDALKKALTGIAEEYQATDRGDLDMNEIRKKAGSA